MLDHLKNAVEFASNLPRYREIVGVLVKYGFTEKLPLMALQRSLGMEVTPPPLHESGLLSKPVAERARLALEELGPTFVKFGQIVSSRRDLVTDEFYVEFSKLQSSVPPFPAREARAIVVEEFGHPVGRLFAHFEDEPIGSASIAQVHRAKLHDGRVVAVKIQRPNITEVIKSDLAILHDFAVLVQRYVPDLASLNPVGLVEDFSETLLKELDFNNEAINNERFAEQFKDNEWIKVPAIHRELSTPKVLTMEFVEGLSVNDRAGLEKAGVVPSALAVHMTELIYEQIFDHGFFHADPHPGNMFIQPGGVTVLLDYGMMGSFTPAFRSSIARLVAGLAGKDMAVVMRSILTLSEEGYTADPTKMQSDIEVLCEAHLDRPLREINLGDVLNRLLDLLRNNNLRMKRSFYLGIKALTQVEAVGRSLDPDLNFIEIGSPYAERLIREKYEPRHLFRILRGLVGESLDLLEDFPHDFRNAYQRLKHGRLSIPLEHKIDPMGFEPLRKTLDSIMNRLANAILAASVLICSSIILLAGIPPEVGGVSLPGIVGIVTGSYLCLRLILSIWRHGGL